MSERQCTCHPDDHPPVPCAEKYALSECKAAASSERQLGAQFPGNETFDLQEGWVAHDGSEDRPVDEYAVVDARNAKGWTVTTEAWALLWKNVTSYRLVEA